MELAFRNAKKGKREKWDVQEFEFSLEENLLALKRELEVLSYEPRPLTQFPIRDPKTRLISASHFRDRVVHHALINVIQPVFEPGFIHDSCANQIGKEPPEHWSDSKSSSRRFQGTGDLKITQRMVT